MSVKDERPLTVCPVHDVCQNGGLKEAVRCRSRWMVNFTRPVLPQANFLFAVQDSNLASAMKSVVLRPSSPNHFTLIHRDTRGVLQCQMTTSRTLLSHHPECFVSSYWCFIQEVFPWYERERLAWGRETAANMIIQAILGISSHISSEIPNESRGVADSSPSMAKLQRHASRPNRCAN